jgi:hypothetical protein
MFASTARRRLFCCCLATAALTGCGSTQAVFPSASPIQGAWRGGSSLQVAAYKFSLLTPGHVVPEVRLDRRGSWMSPQAKHTDLLYASEDTSGEVNVYSYKTPNAKGLLGQLTGFNIPGGLCSDSSGNVYITDFAGDDVVEYAKGGTKPIKRLKIPGDPAGCSVDAVTGNLAVSTYAHTYHKTDCGAVFVFPKAKSPPTLYTYSKFCNYWYPGYDNSGNLYVQGWSKKFVTGLAELPKGKSDLRGLTLKGFTIGFPGTVIWVGTTLALTDQAYKGGATTAVYYVTVSGTTATLTSKTILKDTCLSTFTDVAQPWIMGMKLVGGNTYCRYRFGYWNNSAGGDPRKTINTDIAPRNTGGTTVSR